MVFFKEPKKLKCWENFWFSLSTTAESFILPFLVMSHIQNCQSSLETLSQTDQRYLLHPAANFNILSVSQSGSFKCREATIPPITPDPVIFWAVKSLSETETLTLTRLSRSSIFLSYRQLFCQSRNWPLSNGRHLGFVFKCMFTCESIGETRFVILSYFLPIVTFWCFFTVKPPTRLNLAILI